MGIEAGSCSGASAGRAARSRCSARLAEAEPDLLARLERIVADEHHFASYRPLLVGWGLCRDTNLEAVIALGDTGAERALLDAGRLEDEVLETALHGDGPFAQVLLTGIEIDLLWHGEVAARL